MSSSLCLGGDAGPLSLKELAGYVNGLLPDLGSFFSSSVAIYLGSGSLTVSVCFLDYKFYASSSF